MKLASLLKLLRCSRVATFAVLFAATTSGADASQYCMRARQLPPASDPQLKARIAERLQAIPVMKNHQVREVAPGFAIAWQDEEECRKLFRCFHFLLDTRDRSATIVFAYRGTGSIHGVGTPPDVWSDPLQDHYSLNAFETDDFNWIEVRIPRLPGPVWLGAIRSDDKNLRSCGYLKNM